MRVHGLIHWATTIPQLYKAMSILLLHGVWRKIIMRAIQCPHWFKKKRKTVFGSKRKGKQCSKIGVFVSFRVASFPSEEGAAEVPCLPYASDGRLPVLPVHGAEQHADHHELPGECHSGDRIKSFMLKMRNDFVWYCPSGFDVSLFLHVCRAKFQRSVHLACSKLRDIYDWGHSSL